MFGRARSYDVECVAYTALGPVPLSVWLTATDAVAAHEIVADAPELIGTDEAGAPVRLAEFEVVCVTRHFPDRPHIVLGSVAAAVLSKSKRGQRA